MWFPVMLQRLTEVARTDTPMDMCTLRPQGAPVLCDLLDFATWRVWRVGLRAWKHVPPLAGAEPGTLCVGAPELISLVAWDMSAENTCFGSLGQVGARRLARRVPASRTHGCNATHIQ
jgi:hypothetical protein